MPDTITAPAALITGATSGLGAAYARQLARAGHPLILVARDRPRLEATAAALHAEHRVRVEVISADLATDAGVDAVVARIDAGLDDDARFVGLLVNNAGFGTRGSLLTGDRASQEAMVRVHVLAVNRLTQAALAPMARRQRGAIITVSSVASYLTSPGAVNYCATKAYQRVAMEGLAAEVARRGIYVQACCPGFTRTEFHARAEMKTSQIPGFLWMDADEVVAVSLAALERRAPVTVVPGFTFRAIVLLVRYLPRWILMRATRRYQATRGVQQYGPSLE